MRRQHRGSLAEDTRGGAWRHVAYLLASDAAWPAFRHRVVITVEQLFLHMRCKAPAGLLLLCCHRVANHVQSLLQSDLCLLKAKLALATGTLLQPRRGGLLDILQQPVDDVECLLLECFKEVCLEHFLP